MSILDFFKREKRAEDNTSTSLETSNTQIDVTIEKALEVPAISGAIDLIANTFSLIPIKLYKGSEEVKDDIRTNLLNYENGDTLTSTEMKACMCRDYLTDGNGYIFIKQTKGEASSLHYVAHKYISVMEGTDPIFKQNTFSVNGATYNDFQFIKLLRHSENGATGKGIINENKNIIALMIQLMEFEKNQAMLNGLKRGFLESERMLSTQALEALKTAWSDLFMGNSGNKAIVLNEGVKFKECSSSPTELQLQESKEQNSKEIYKLFNIPIEMLSGKPSIETYRIFIKQTIMPICELFEKSLNQNLLKEKEKGEYHFKSDYSEILKGDIESRYETYKLALTSGLMTINEIRQKENLVAIEGMDVLPLSLGGVYYDIKNKTYYVPNMEGAIGNKISEGVEEDGK